MARIRTIKPEFFRHEGLYEAEIKTKLPLRIAYAGLWTSCDREGRFKWRPRQLKLDSLPYDDVDFSRVLDALESRGFLVKYEIEGDQYGAIPSWKTHQVINNKEMASLLPEPPEYLIESMTYTREPRVDDALTTPLNLDQGEGKGKEKERKGKGKELAAIVSRPDFVNEQIWNDWMLIRKKKAAPLTQTAWDAFEVEVAKSGWSTEDAVRECCLRNWQSFKAEWVGKDKAKTGYQHFNKQEALEASNRAVAERFLTKDITNA